MVIVGQEMELQMELNINLRYLFRSLKIVRLGQGRRFIKIDF